MSLPDLKHASFDKIRENIGVELVKHSLPSLALAIAYHGTIVWEEAWGWANREARVPASPHTLYSLASISKPTTATGLMILVERGLIDLDRPIDDYLGNAKLTPRMGKAADATVRRIANHSSGLPLHYQFFYADEPARRPPMEETIRRYANLVTVPGERYCYSNLGYGLLDHIIARVSGRSYRDFMRQEVFLPLGMLRASVDVASELEDYQAIRYGSDGLPYPFYDFDHPGGSAIFCSAHDLVRFGMFHLKAHLTNQAAILSDASIDAMQTPTISTGGTSGYGIGWSINEDKFGYRTVQHSGSSGGVNTTLVLIPSEEIAVAVLMNAAGALPFQVADDIIAALLPSYAEKLAEERAQVQARPQEVPTSTPTFPRALTGNWEGNVSTYTSDLPLHITIKRDGDIHAQLGAQLKALVNEVTFADSRLGGVMVGNIGTDDANRTPYHLRLDLTLRGRRLNGVLIADWNDEQGEGGAPGHRHGNALSSWVELHKVR